MISWTRVIGWWPLDGKKWVYKIKGGDAELQIVDNRTNHFHKPRKSKSASQEIQFAETEVKMTEVLEKAEKLRQEEILFAFYWKNNYDPDISFQIRRNSKKKFL